MDYGLVIFVLTGSLVSISFAQTRQYFFVSTSLNWTNAQSICRRDYTDLATIESTADIVDVSNTTSNYTGKAWIGLYDDLENSWRWSFNDGSFYGAGEETYRNWLSSQPNNVGGQQYCVELLSTSPFFGLWGDSECNMTKQFVCYNGTVNGTASFVLVETPLNWTDAQIFCRANYVDLASIRNSTENAVVTSTARGNFVWIGLYRQKVWSDGSNSLFRHWADEQPDSGRERCVAAQFNNSGRWSDEDCSLAFPFICFTTIPPNAEGFRTIAQLETSIALQWNKVNDNVGFILQFNGSETNFIAPAGDGPITHAVSSLTAGTFYTFTLFSVFKNVRSSGVNITAATYPPTTDSFRSTGQNETSITLQWNKVNNDVGYILQFNGSETNFSAPAGDGPINHTVSSLSPATYYLFTLFSVIANIRGTGLQLSAATEPPIVYSFRSTGQNETSITLQWNQVNDNVSYILQFNGSETNFSAAAGDGPITHTVSSLSPTTYYTFILFSVFENVRSSGFGIVAFTAPSNAEGFRSTGQNETSITLQWNQVNNIVGYILQFNGSETNFIAAAGDGPINHTVSSLTAGTKYTFTLFSVFWHISSGVNVTAVTAPQNAEGFRSTGQNETSITLQWNQVNGNVSYILQFNGSETNFSAAAGDGPITHTVSSLTSGTKYTFTLFSVFENVRSSGVNIAAVTGKMPCLIHFVVNYLLSLAIY
ncbi:tenascin-like [Amphiprion ocellaris]|uniref:tenascin-like n=1 Tax=Amphiprion ocellaris TaxID=80972 RepID=UPI002411583F|nr:tenascin-like [Amphiprion ocellaris]XP_054863628.1 tenascin-like [Amphiprion ocellaris]